ncbi:MAG: hypothetical protein GIKADHBN_00365 [Phycisphaerales bacterium]|nr:hypothetical protein [Phycisphaerales bacterium]
MQQDVSQLLEQARQAGLETSGLDAAALQQQAAGGLLDQLPAWMPPAAVIVAIGAVLVGVILWLIGGRIIKPGFVLVGGIIGSAFGAVYLPALTPTVAGIPAAYPGMMGGLMLGMIAAVIVYRFAMASLAAGIVGSAAVLTSIVGLSYMPGALPSADAVEQQGDRTVITADGTDVTIRQQVEEQVRDWSGRLKDAAQKYKDAQTLAGGASKDDPDAGDAEQQAADQERIDAAKRTAQAVSDHIAGRWQMLPQRSRLIIAGAWMAGAIAGFMLGLLLPTKAAATVSALTGSAMLIAGSVNLADHYTSAGPWIAGVSALGWLGSWLVLSACGLMFQSRKKAKATLASEQSKP